MSTTTKPASTPVKKDTRLIDGLNLVLADSYALMALTHLAHWNVEGEDFFPLHKAFQEQYEELFEAVDEIAERVRAIDGYAMGGLGTFARAAQMEEFKAPLPQKDYVAALIVAVVVFGFGSYLASHNQRFELLAAGVLVDDAVRTRDQAGEVSDLQTQDLMIKRLQFHEKTLWMLKSYLKH